jgi:hypothetical protein
LRGFEDPRMERESFEGEAQREGFREGDARETQKPKRAKVPTWINRLGSKEGTRLSGWDQAAEASMRGREVSQSSAGAERGAETLLRSSIWSKALKGEAQECVELKEALKGSSG